MTGLFFCVCYVAGILAMLLLLDRYHRKQAELQRDTALRRLARLQAADEGSDEGTDQDYARQWDHQVASARSDFGHQDDFDAWELEHEAGR